MTKIGKSLFDKSTLDKSTIGKMQKPNLKFGKYIRNLRTEKKETLHDVSKGTDIDSPLLSKIERGVRLPTDIQINKIAKYFNLNESDLKVMVIAEKIIKEYGINDTTYNAVSKVEERITPYLTGKKK